jgi:hypothetical protein
MSSHVLTPSTVENYLFWPQNNLGEMMEQGKKKALLSLQKTSAIQSPEALARFGDIILKQSCYPILPIHSFKAA